MTHSVLPAFLPPHVSAPESLQALKDVTHVYTDLDGSLLAPGGRLLTTHKGVPSAKTAHLLVELKQHDIEVIIVTGRDRIQGTEIMRLLNVKTFIGELGCVLQEGFGAMAKRRYELGDWKHHVLAEGLAPGELPPNTTPFELIQQSGVIDKLFAAFPGKLEVHNTYASMREVTVMLRGCVDYKQAAAILNKCSLPLQLLDNGVIHPQKHGLSDCEEIHIYHVLPRGAGKGHAVAADMAHRGLSRAQTVAVGDAVGDIDMGEHTNSFVLVNRGSVESIVMKYCAGRGADGDSKAAMPLLAMPFQIYRTQEMTTDGWVEFAHSLLAAKKLR